MFDLRCVAAPLLDARSVRAADMAIVDTVWGALARFNAPYHGRRRRSVDFRHFDTVVIALLRGLEVAFVWLIAALAALTGLLVVIGAWLLRRLWWLLWQTTLLVWVSVLPALGRVIG